MSEPFIGEIRVCPYNFAPRGWTTCEGQEMYVQQNYTLYSIIGILYGGDGLNTFRLPNLCGRQLLGTGTGPGLSGCYPGERGGLTRTPLTEANLPEHTHDTTTQDMAASLKASTTDGTETTPAPDRYLAEIDLNRSKHDSMIYGFGPIDAQLGGGEIKGQIVSGHTGTTSASFYNLPPYLPMNYIIALDGIYPSRN